MLDSLVSEAAISEVVDEATSEVRLSRIAVELGVSSLDEGSGVSVDVVSVDVSVGDGVGEGVGVTSTACSAVVAGAGSEGVVSAAGASIMNLVSPGSLTVAKKMPGGAAVYIKRGCERAYQRRVMLQMSLPEQLPRLRKLLARSPAGQSQSCHSRKGRPCHQSRIQGHWQ